MWPGLQLQKLTTREPDLDELAVSIASLQAVLELRAESNLMLGILVEAADLDVLAEVVDADGGAPLVHHLCCTDDVVQVRAGNETLRELHSRPGLLGEVPQ